MRNAKAMYQALNLPHSLLARFSKSSRTSAAQCFFFRFVADGYIDPNKVDIRLRRLLSRTQLSPFRVSSDVPSAC